jgi:hypothetical protein
LVSPKFIEERLQILRPTTPELKDLWGPVRKNDSEFCVAHFRLRIPARIEIFRVED